jgi:hypothetical protein
MKTMTKSSKIDFLVEEINLAVLELQDSLKSVPNSPIEPTVTTLKAPNPNDANREPITKTVIPSIMDISPLACFVYLLIEVVARIEGIIEAVDQLASLAEFKLAMVEKSKQKKPTNKPNLDIQDHETMKALQKV